MQYVSQDQRDAEALTRGLRSLQLVFERQQQQQQQQQQQAGSSLAGAESLTPAPSSSTQQHGQIPGHELREEPQRDAGIARQASHSSQQLARELQQQAASQLISQLGRPVHAAPAAPAQLGVSRQPSARPQQLGSIPGLQQQAASQLISQLGRPVHAAAAAFAQLGISGQPSARPQHPAPSSSLQPQPAEQAASRPHLPASLDVPESHLSHPQRIARRSLLDAQAQPRAEPPPSAEMQSLLRPEQLEYLRTTRAREAAFARQVRPRAWSTPCMRCRQPHDARPLFPSKMPLAWPWMHHVVICVRRWLPCKYGKVPAHCRRALLTEILHCRHRCWATLGCAYAPCSRTHPVAVFVGAPATASQHAGHWLGAPPAHAGIQTARQPTHRAPWLP